jgi:chromatin segregation and condensation protein Rec8/ScpA/Scc1 (kleisin family)
MEFILNLFKERDEVSFYEIALAMTEKIRVVVTFLALLEMMKSKIIAINQFDSYGDITIVKLPTEEVA